jgi:hypothetical protein
MSGRDSAAQSLCASVTSRFPRAKNFMTVSPVWDFQSFVYCVIFATSVRREPD